MRWKRVKLRRRWRLSSVSPDRACEGGVGFAHAKPESPTVHHFA